MPCTRPSVSCQASAIRASHTPGLIVPQYRIGLVRSTISIMKRELWESSRRLPAFGDNGRCASTLVRAYRVTHTSTRDKKLAFPALYHPRRIERALLVQEMKRDASGFVLQLVDPHKTGNAAQLLQDVRQLHRAKIESCRRQAAAGPDRSWLLALRTPRANGLADREALIIRLQRIA